MIRIPIVLLLGLFPLVCSAQTQSPAQPIELPEFIVTGKEQVGVPGAAKQGPLRPPRLSKALLDSLNPIEKLALPAMPGAPFPTLSRTFTNRAGWLEAEIGNYLTPLALAGYSFTTGGYLIDLAANIQSSSGWLAGSDFVTGGASVHSSYVAPEKFVFFGGSETQVDLGLQAHSYNLYAQPRAPHRSTTAFNGGVGTRGEWEDVRFIARVDVKRFSITDSGATSVADQNFSGSLDVIKNIGEIGLGAYAGFALNSFNSVSYNNLDLGPQGSVRTKSFYATARATAQWASTTTNASRFGVGLNVRSEWQLNGDVSVDAGLESGLRMQTITQMMKVNPYLSGMSTVDVPYDVFAISGTVRYHPLRSMAASAGILLRQTERDLVFTQSDVGLFAPRWLSTTTVQLNGSLRWEATTADAVTANLLFTGSSLDSTATPYVAPLVMSATYQRRITSALRTELCIEYVGERYANVENTRTLDGYVDVRVYTGYSVSPVLDLYVRAENLMGSTMVIWEGYRERGTFICGGLSWRW